MKDFCDGYSFKSHPVFKSYPQALQVIVYYDDVETANPLGAKAGHHKLGMKYVHVYYYISNVHVLEFFPLYLTHEVSGIN